MSVETEEESVRFHTKKIIQDEKICKEVSKDKSCHKFQESLLDSSLANLNNWGTSYLCLVILVLSNSCLALENIAKYGLVVNPFLWLKIYFSNLINLYPFLFFSGIHFFTLSSLGLEILLSKGIIPEIVGLTLVVLLLACQISVPLLTINFIDTFAVAFTVVVGYVTVFLKLVSYHMVNYSCRKNVTCDTKALPQSALTDQNKHKDFTHGSKDKKLIQYPDNLNLKDIYYFLFAPTLCYELNFPLLPHIRKRFLIKKLLEMMFLVVFILSSIQLLIIPVVINYQDSFQDLAYVKLFEIYFKLTIPVFAIWMLCFYAFFHVWLNVIGEVLRFGDRSFYGDWWNAESMPVWWRKWNIPVHKWCLRHIYKPMLQSGYTKIQAVFAVFIVSGIFHEYLFSVPLKIVKIIQLVGMPTGQVSFFAFTGDKPPKYGNLSLWFNCAFMTAFFLLYYYYGYYVEHCLKIHP